MRMFQAHDHKRVKRVRFVPGTHTLSALLRAHRPVIHLDMPTDVICSSPSLLDCAVDELAYSADGGILALGTPFRAVTFRCTNGTPVSSNAGGSRQGYIRLTDFPRYEEPLGGFKPVNMAFTPITSPQKTRFGVTGREFTLWNPHTQEYNVADAEGDYRGVSFGPDGNTVASIEYHAHALCVWNVKPFQVLFRTDLKGIDAFDNGSVAMTPDGGRVIVAAGNVLRCLPIHGGGGWDTATKKPPLEITLHPSGRTLLVADGSKKVTAYDTSNGRPAAQFDWGVGKVGCVTYSPDGTLAAAGGEKGQVVVWDAE